MSSKSGRSLKTSHQLYQRSPELFISKPTESKEVVKPENTDESRLKVSGAGVKVFRTVRVPSAVWSCCSSRFRSELGWPEHASVKVLSICSVHSPRRSGGDISNEGLL